MTKAEVEELIAGSCLCADGLCDPCKRVIAALKQLTVEPNEPRYYEMCEQCGVGHDPETPHRSYLKCGFCGQVQANPMPKVRSCCEAGKTFDIKRVAERTSDAR